MRVNYRVYTKATESSRWKDTGIIESNRDAAADAWDSIIRRIQYHAYKLEPVTYGTPYERA
jgi:hypothetical protein